MERCPLRQVLLYIELTRVDTKGEQHVSSRARAEMVGGPFCNRKHGIISAASLLISRLHRCISIMYDRTCLLFHVTFVE